MDKKGKSVGAAPDMEIVEIDTKVSEKVYLKDHINGNSKVFMLDIRTGSVTRAKIKKEYVDNNPKISNMRVVGAGTRTKRFYAEVRPYEFLKEADNITHASELFQKMVYSMADKVQEIKNRKNEQEKNS